MNTVELQQHGDQVGLTFSDQIRVKLGLAAGQELVVEEYADGIRLVRRQTKLERQMALARKVLDDNAGALQALASR